MLFTRTLIVLFLITTSLKAEQKAHTPPPAKKASAATAKTWQQILEDLETQTAEITKLELEKSWPGPSSGLIEKIEWIKAHAGINIEGKMSLKDLIKKVRDSLGLETNEEDALITQIEELKDPVMNMYFLSLKDKTKTLDTNTRVANVEKFISDREPKKVEPKISVAEKVKNFSSAVPGVVDTSVEVPPLYAITKFEQHFKITPTPSMTIEERSKTIEAAVKDATKGQKKEKETFYSWAGKAFQRLDKIKADLEN